MGPTSQILTGYLFFLFLVILNSTEDIIACIQPWQPEFEFTKMTTEDCLILNVWTPYPRPQNASVMVRLSKITVGRFTPVLLQFEVSD